MKRIRSARKFSHQIPKLPNTGFELEISLIINMFDLYIYFEKKYTIWIEREKEKYWIDKVYNSFGLMRNKQYRIDCYEAYTFSAEVLPPNPKLPN
jgi:hypothetical protein